MGDSGDPLLAQQQEIEALEAIYGGDFALKPGVWNRPAFAIKVQPVGLEEGVMAHVTLTVKVRETRSACVYVDERCYIIDD